MLRCEPVKRGDDDDPELLHEADVRGVVPLGCASDARR
jgi:hypothetical protein